jgi:hypothetical protein
MMTFIDGVKYFDIKENADDQRLKISATEMVEPIFLSGEAHRCMQDTEFLFETTESLFNHKH